MVAGKIVIIPIRDRNANNNLLTVRPELVEGSMWFDRPSPAASGSGARQRRACATKPCLTFHERILIVRVPIANWNQPPTLSCLFVSLLQPAFHVLIEIGHRDQSHAMADHAVPCARRFEFANRCNAFEINADIDTRCC